MSCQCYLASFLIEVKDEGVAHPAWGTPAPFGGWTVDNPEPSDARVQGYQWTWALIKSEAGGGWDDPALSSWVGIYGTQVESQMFSYNPFGDLTKSECRFTLGPPGIPVTIKWQMIDVTTQIVASSGSVTLEELGDSDGVTIAGPPSKLVLRNMHIFACPYHLS